ncbi:hypothetical protein FB45DRAFT_1091210 [Roridomyces roridus]|uniref:MYND-type domain-containing protein n=1 Tax=Roridomyces roridus TaxID=1738132 RepID=A0AAD7BIM8_9AGAR|nr:hypothetical protein FB45DRAFT_1091210 [Roridomyces roridus]
MAGTYQDPHTMDGVSFGYRELRMGLCAMQAALTTEVLLYFTRRRFEERWLSAPPAERGKHVLAGLASVCPLSLTLHQSRAFCVNELNVAAHRNDGRLLIKLLRGMLVANPGRIPENPLYIPDPVWDAIAAHQRTTGASAEEKLALEVVLIMRNDLITHVIVYVLRSFLVYNAPLTGPLAEKLLRLQVKHAGSFNDIEKKSKQYCIYCRKPNETTVKYSRCRRCWEAIGLEILYCSVACQKADWKTGHKVGCGKSLDLESIKKEVPVVRGAPKHPPPIVGPPLPGFTRSSALGYQVMQLNLWQEYDYFFTPQTRPVYLKFTHAPVQAVVRAARSKALDSGDRPTVARLAHFLWALSSKDTRALSFGLTGDFILEQFKAEYEFEEIHAAVDEMNNRMIRDPLLRPPLLAEAGFSAGKWEDYYKTWPANKPVEIAFVPIDADLLEKYNFER